MRATSDYFSEQQVNEFLNAFFTFKNYGENYSRYEIFLSQQAKKREEKRRDQGNFLPQFFGNSVFLSSENYIRIVNEYQIEVICYVIRQIDSLNQEGKIVAKNIEKEVMLKLYYTFEETDSHFLIESYEQLDSL
ncbi:MAG: hypothetical protein IC227_02875 [Enterococcus lacertideformus]|uniref:Uncharacterized protein n=1 Tax=Enterococcus lacertideformus TaxID=2771493 RepID=A0A931ATE7_9ENTE|nr:hypothetical protein [Enterococcus lacertideformus]